MVRLPDWPARLSDFIESRRQRDFLWGERDCCLFACDAVQVVTGHDPAKRWRGLYASEKGARRLLRDNGGVIGLAIIAFGAPVSAANAGRGDVVLIDTPDGEALGVCLGSVSAAQGKAGIVFNPISAAKAAWRV